MQGFSSADGNQEALKGRKQLLIFAVPSQGSCKVLLHLCVYLCAHVQHVHAPTQTSHVYNAHMCLHSHTVYSIVVHVHTCAYAYINVIRYVCTRCSRAHVYMLAHMHMYAHTCARVCACIHVQCGHTFTRVYMVLCVHITCARAHVHTCTCMCDVYVHIYMCGCLCMYD